MQQPSNFFTYTERDRQVARKNLELMVADKEGIGGDNSGWCYMVAPLRSFLADPKFISLLKRYKSRYYHNGKLSPNTTFIKFMYGSDYKTNKELKDVLLILNTLCKHTDCEGCLLPVDGDNKRYSYPHQVTFYDMLSRTIETRTVPKNITSPYVYLVKLLHDLEPQYNSSGKVRNMYNHLSDCTAIMTESTNILAYFDSKQIRRGATYDLTKMEEDLKNGLCVTACANGRHFFNIYKDHNNKYHLLGNKQYYQHVFDHLIDAIVVQEATAPQPEDKYHICITTAADQLHGDKKRGINNYLTKWKSYLDAINTENFEKLNRYIKEYNDFDTKTKTLIHLFEKNVGTIWRAYDGKPIINNRPNNNLNVVYNAYTTFKDCIKQLRRCFDTYLSSCNQKMNNFVTKYNEPAVTNLYQQFKTEHGIA